MTALERLNPNSFMFDGEIMSSISLILPCYNSAKTIERCLNSVINQTMLPDELIMIDDGSSDDTSEIIKKFTLDHEFCRLIEQDNKGALAARIVGIKSAKGEYVSFIDSDDWIDKDHFSYIKALVEKNKPDIIAMGCMRETAEKVELRTINRIKNGVYKDGELSEILPKVLRYNDFFEFGILPYLWNKLFKTSIIQHVIDDIDIELYDGEDVALIFSCLLKASSLLVDDSCMYHYMFYSDSVSHKKKETYYRNVSKLYLYLYDQFIKTDYADVLLPQLDQYMRLMIWQSRPDKFIKSQIYLFPFDRVEKGARIVLYGAGVVGQTYYHQLQNIEYCIVVGWADRNWDSISVGAKLISPDDISLLKYDCIIVAVDSERLKERIKQDLESRGLKNIIF